MTGDGVNDAPALKAAHIGIAMGRRGTDVAREAAALVLLDDDFSSIVGAVRIGRRIYDNIRKAMTYVLAIHAPIAGLSLIPVLFGQPMIILPLHLVFMELIVDPACSVAFEMEREEPNVMQRPPRHSKKRLFARHLVVRSLLQGAGALFVSSVMFFGTLRLGMQEDVVRSMTFATLVIGNLALIFTNRSLTGTSLSRTLAPNRGLSLLTGGALLMLALVLYVPWLGDLFRVARPSAAQLAACLGAGVLVIGWVEVVKLIDLRIAAAGTAP